MSLAIFDALRFGVEFETMFLMPRPPGPMRNNNFNDLVPALNARAAALKLGVTFQSGDRCAQTATSPPDRWCVVEDGSLQDDLSEAYTIVRGSKPTPIDLARWAWSSERPVTAEIVSPVSKIRDVYRIARISADVFVVPGRMQALHNRSTSHHVHMSHPDFMTPSTLERICAAWALFEDAFIALVATWRSASNYCDPWDMPDMGFFSPTFVADRSTIAPIVRAYTKSDRFKTLNLMNLVDGNPPSGTLECRLKHGSVDAEEISAWVMLLAVFFTRCLSRGRIDTLYTLEQATSIRTDEATSIAALFQFLGVPVLTMFWKHRTGRPILTRDITSECTTEALCSAVRSAIRLEGNVDGQAEHIGYKARRKRADTPRAEKVKAVA